MAFDAGRGLTMLYEREVRGNLARGDLVAVLEEYSTPFAGFYSSIRDGATPRCRSARWWISSDARGSARVILPEVGLPRHASRHAVTPWEPPEP